MLKKALEYIFQFSFCHQPNSFKKRVPRNFDDLWELWPWKLESIESPFWPLKWIVKVHLWCFFLFFRFKTGHRGPIWAHMFIYLRLETNWRIIWRSLGGRELETPEWLIPLRKLRNLPVQRKIKSWKLFYFYSPL